MLLPYIAHLRSGIHLSFEGAQLEARMEHQPVQNPCVWVSILRTAFSVAEDESQCDWHVSSSPACARREILARLDDGGSRASYFNSVVDNNSVDTQRNEGSRRHCCAWHLHRRTKIHRRTVLNSIYDGRCNSVRFSVLAY